MNLQELKAAIAKREDIALGKLSLVRQLDQTTQQPTEWLSHWDNEKRVRVTIHSEIVDKLKADPNMEGLAFKREEVPAVTDREAYTRYVIITPTSIEVEL